MNLSDVRFDRAQEFLTYVQSIRVLTVGAYAFVITRMDNGCDFTQMLRRSA